MADVAKLASTLTTLDITFFILSLAISVLIGVYFANKNESINEYMLGGHNQKLLPVSLSMMTSFISGLTLIGSPAELYNHGILYTTVVISVLLSAPIVAFVFLPVFWRLRCTSVLEYLELRYSARLKRFMSIVFILQMTLYNAVVLYIPSLSLQEVLGISETISIGAVGASCILYSTVGGIKAVIWTDFFQSGLMYLSLLCICIGGTIEAGGISKLLEVNIEGGRLSFEPFLNLDLTTRHTLWIMLSGVLVVKLFLNGVNQVQVQRALSLPTLRQAQWSQLVSALMTAVIIVIASYVGLIIYATYRNCDPFDNHEIGKRDAVAIYYVSTHLTGFNGLRGIFVAGVFAATLSTLSSFQNSMSVLVLEDFLKPYLLARYSKNEVVARNRTQLYLSKLLALLFGLSCLAVTFAVGRISSLLQVANLLFGALGAPFVAAYLMGMLTRFTNTIGITVGVIAGYSFGIYIQMYQTFYLPPLEPTLGLSTEGCAGFNSSTLSTSWTSGQVVHQKQVGPWDLSHMSYFWLPAFAMLFTMLVAALVSLATGGRRQQVGNRYLVSWLHRGDSDDLDDDELEYEK